MDFLKEQLLNEEPRARGDPRVSSEVGPRAAEGATLVPQSLTPPFPLPSMPPPRPPPRPEVQGWQLPAGPEATSETHLLY